MDTVFITYAHESDDHDARVLALADQLRADGIDPILDQYEPNPPQGWTYWMIDALDRADAVLMICSPAYYRRVMRREEPGKGLGAQWEGNLIFERLYRDLNQGHRYIPVQLLPASPDDVPDPARGYQRYSIATADLTDPGYEALYRHLIGDPAIVRPPLGVKKTLGPRARPGSGPQAKTVASPRPVSAAAEMQRKALEQQLNDVLAEYQAATTQASHTLSDVDRLRLQRSAGRLLDEAKRIETQLNALDA